MAADGWIIIQHLLDILELTLEILVQPMRYHSYGVDHLMLEEVVAGCIAPAENASAEK